MMKLFFFILYLGISISLACPPNSPYEGMVPFFSWFQIGQIIFHSYLSPEVTSAAYLAKTAAEKSEIIWSNVMVDTSPSDWYSLPQTILGVMAGKQYFFNV